MIASCPTCGVAIELVDVDVRADEVKCRQCGATSAYSVIRNRAPVADTDANRQSPPAGVRCVDDGTTVTITTRLWQPLFTAALCGFAVLWNAIVLSLFLSGRFDATKSADKSVSPEAAAYVPLVFGGFGAVVACMAIAFLFGTWRLRITASHVAVKFGVGPLEVGRRYVRSAIKGVSPCVIANGTSPFHGIQLDGPDKQFGVGMADDAREWIEASLRGRLGLLPAPAEKKTLPRAESAG